MDQTPPVQGGHPPEAGTFPECLGKPSNFGFMRNLCVVCRINYGGGGKNGSKETTYAAVTEIQADDCGGLDEVEAVNMVNGEWAQRSSSQRNSGKNQGCLPDFWCEQLSRQS